MHSDLCVHPLPLSGHFEAPGWPRLFPLITEQVERRWGESCRAAASFPLLQKPSNNGAAGRILLLFFFSAPGWSIWEFHTDAVDKTCCGEISVLRLRAPHGALRASDCQSARPFGTCGALQGNVPPQYRPALDRCATASPPTASLPPQRKPSYPAATQTEADHRKYIYIFLMWRPQTVGG